MVSRPAPADRPGLHSAAFRRLWIGTGASNLSDGILLGAAPLLAATLTRDPALVSGLLVARYLPWFLFTLHAGAVVDRYDNRILMTAANAIRAVALAGLALAINLDAAGIGLLYGVVFALGAAETIVDNAATSVLPRLVRRDDLEQANGRLTATGSVLDELVGPPIGAALFAIAAVAAFATGAASFALAAAVFAALPLPRRGTVARRRGAMRHEIHEGMRWFWRHRVVRATALMAAGINLFAAAVLGVLVLVAQERLGLDDTGYGLLLSAAAVGGIAGAVTAPRLVRWLGYGPAIVFVEIGFPALGALGLALTRDPVVAAAMLALDSFGSGIGNVLVATVRQAAVPEHLLGRVTSAYRLFALGALPLGAALGGLLGRVNLTAPLWASFIGLVLLAIAVAPVLTTATVREVLGRTTSTESHTT